MNALSSIRTRHPATGTIALSSAPVVVMPDVVNLLYERFCIDVFGEPTGRRLAIEAAADASRAMLDAIFEGAAVDRARRLALARMVFTACGEGKFGIDSNGARRFAWATALVNPATLRSEDSGKEADGDAFAAGFIGAAVEAGLDRPGGSIIAREFRCVARGDERCELEFVVREAAERVPPLSQNTSMAGLDEMVIGEDEDSVSDLARQLASYLDAQPVDADGTVSLFGTRVSMRPASWYGRIYCAAHTAIAAEAGLAIERVDDVIRALGRRWVERLLLPALGSDEWELFAGGPPETGRDVITQATALARATGLGRWAVRGYASGHRVVIRAPWLAEAGWVRHRGARSIAGTAFMEGAAAALLSLAAAVDGGLSLSDESAAIDAVRSRMRRVTITPVSSISLGAAHCEVEATLA